MASTGMSAPIQAKDLLRIALTSLCGTTIEWYDFFIYGTAAALVFPKLFFPSFSPLAGTLASFGTFAVGFIARPVGAVIFGHLGDRFGRKWTLVATLITMGSASTLVGCLPTYAMVGVAAPILLTLLRFVQGVSAGGEWGGAVLIATENAPGNKRGFYGSFAQLGTPAAVVIANAVFLIMGAIVPNAQFIAWAWRIPFLLSVILIIVGLYIRLRLEETSAFKDVQESHSESRLPIIDAFRAHGREILLAAGAFIVVNGMYFIIATYSIAYGTSLGVSRNVMLTAVLICSLFQIPVILFFARLSDRVGRKNLYLAGALLAGLWAFPLFWLLNTKAPALIIIALCVSQIFLNMMYGPQAAFFSELFSTRVRYSGASLGYQIGAVLGGGFAPTIATALLAATKTSTSISIYIAVLAAISFLSVLLLTETFQRDAAWSVAEPSSEALQAAEG